MTLDTAVAAIVKLRAEGASRVLVSDDRVEADFADPFPGAEDIIDPDPPSGESPEDVLFWSAQR